MDIRSLAIRLALVALMVLPSTSCYMLDQLRALRVIKDAHTQYQRSDYERAAELYEEALANDPNLVEAYFYLANSYDQQFRPALTWIIREDGDSGGDTGASVWYKRCVHKRLATTETPA